MAQVLSQAMHNFNPNGYPPNRPYPDGGNCGNASAPHQEHLNAYTAYYAPLPGMAAHPMQPPQNNLHHMPPQHLIQHQQLPPYLQHRAHSFSPHSQPPHLQLSLHHPHHLLPPGTPQPQDHLQMYYQAEQSPRYPPPPPPPHYVQHGMEAPQLQLPLQLQQIAYHAMPQVSPQQYSNMVYPHGMHAASLPFKPRKKSKYSTIWTSKEDKLLRELKEVQNLGWREMAAYFEDRTPNACQFRWRRLVRGAAPGSPIHKHVVDADEPLASESESGEIDEKYDLHQNASHNARKVTGSAGVYEPVTDSGTSTATATTNSTSINQVTPEDGAGARISPSPYQPPSTALLLPESTSPAAASASKSPNPAHDIRYLLN
jgi:hypothetical protein